MLGCGALAREILALTPPTSITLISFALPAIYHNHPEKIVPAVRTAVAKAAGYDRIFLAYADCGTGGELARAATELGIEMMAGPHCFAFYQGTKDFLDRADQEFTSFYLTDFLVRQFDAFVWKPLGLDRHPELRDSYFGHYKMLVYQAQTDDPRACREGTRLRQAPWAGLRTSRHGLRRPRGSTLLRSLMNLDDIFEAPVPSPSQADWP